MALTKIRQEQGVVINEGSTDVDFRVESNGNANMLFVDGGNNAVGIGTNSPDQLLTVGDTSTQYTRLQFYAATNGASTIHFGDGSSAAAYRGYINYAHDSDSLQFATASTERMRIDSSGQVIIGGDTQKTTDWQSDARGLTVVGAKPTIALHDQDNANYVSFISQVSGDQYIYNRGGGKVYFGVSETPGSTPATYMTVSDYGAVTKPLQPAFSVHKNGTGQSNIALNTNVVVTWTHSRFDQNSDFDFVNGRFTAPVTGKYQFNANVLLNNIDDSADYIIVFLATSNENYRFIFDPDLDGDQAYWSVAISVLADMDNGDTATFKVNQGGGSAQTGVDGSAEYTNFTGFLAC